MMRRGFHENAYEYASFQATTVTSIAASSYSTIESMEEVGDCQSEPELKAGTSLNDNYVHAETSGRRQYVKTYHLYESCHV
jgi:hypothetical protein